MSRRTSFAASALPATHPAVAKPPETRGSCAAPAGDGRVRWKWHRGGDSTGLPTCPPESKTTLRQSADSGGEHEVPRAPRSIFLRGGVTWDALPCDGHCCFLAFSCPLQGSARPPSQSALLLSLLSPWNVRLRSSSKDTTDRGWRGGRARRTRVCKASSQRRRSRINTTLSAERAAPVKRKA